MQRPPEPAQYTSGQIAELCAGLGLLQSVGRTGVCWDNAPAESFWSTLKTEFYNRHDWPTKAGAQLAVGAGSKSATTGNDATPPSA